MVNNFVSGKVLEGLGVLLIVGVSFVMGQVVERNILWKEFNKKENN